MRQVQADSVARPQPAAAPTVVNAQAPTAKSDAASPPQNVDQANAGGSGNRTVASALHAPIRPAIQDCPPGPRLAPRSKPANKLTDEQIGQSIQRGVDFMLKQFDEKACRGPRDGLARIAGRGCRGCDPFHNGADVSCVYALMQCDQAIYDPRLNIKGPFMAGCIEATKALISTTILAPIRTAFAPPNWPSTTARKTTRPARRCHRPG